MVQIPNINIGTEIESRFDKSGLTQKEFGARIGMPQQNIYRIFNNESIDTKRLAAISRALQFNFFTLFTPPVQISIDGDHNQLNGNGAYGNVYYVGDAVILERVKSLETLVAEKDERIIELKERIEELKAK